MTIRDAVLLELLFFRNASLLAAFLERPRAHNKHPAAVLKGQIFNQTHKSVGCRELPFAAGEMGTTNSL